MICSANFRVDGSSGDGGVNAVKGDDMPPMIMLNRRADGTFGKNGNQHLSQQPDQWRKSGEGQGQEQAKTLQTCLSIRESVSIEGFDHVIAGCRDSNSNRTHDQRGVPPGGL